MSLAYLPRVLLGLGIFISPVGASNAGPGTIEQPVNLGAQADPAAIPLGPVAYEANYNYGIHALIGAPRPCLHGAMEWEKGVVLEQNLAHAFGISVEPEDSTSVPQMPVVLRVKAWPAPAYSPYTREQVLAATVHCLIRGSGPSPKTPLTIQVVTADPADQAWAGKFAGKYISRPDNDGEPVDPTPVPGTRLETDGMGVTRVTFPAVTKKPAAPPRPPVLIPFRLDTEVPSWELIPVWTGDTWQDPLEALGCPYHLSYDLFNPATPGDEVHALFGRGRYLHWSLSREPTRTVAYLGFVTVDDGDLAAFLHALVFSVQPTAEKPLEITLRSMSEPAPFFPHYLEAGGWEKTTSGGEPAIRGEFVLDATTGKLLRGTVPYATVERSALGALQVIGIPHAGPSKFSEEVRSAYEWHFMSRMKSKDFEPTKEEIQLGLGDVGSGTMQSQFWHAGYREAVLGFHDLALLDNPDAAPAPDAKDDLSRCRLNGWQAGHRRGLEIALALVKEVSAELENSER